MTNYISNLGLFLHGLMLVAEVRKGVILQRDGSRVTLIHPRGRLRLTPEEAQEPKTLLRLAELHSI